MISLTTDIIHPPYTYPLTDYPHTNTSFTHTYINEDETTQPGEAYSDGGELRIDYESIANGTYADSNIARAFNMALANDSFTEYAEIPYYIKATSMTFCIVIMCLGVIGNVMVPIVILKTKDMRNSTNIFLVNLSIADLMVLLVCTPTVLVEVNSKPETWVLGKELCLAVPFVELTVAHASVLTILAISFERYYAICEPLRAGYVCTKTRATLICALAWFFAALFTSPILAIAEHRVVENRDGRLYGQCLTQAATFWPVLFFITVTLLLFVVPLITLIILYSVIAKNLITAASKVVLNKTVDPYNARARKQVILMLGTVVLCFFLCLMPFRILTLWIIIVPPEYIENMNPERYFNILYFTRIMLYINSAINPILYNLMSSKFRIGFCKMCICYRRSSIVIQNRKARRKRAGTLTTGSTTSSSLSRTTNSLKRLFVNRSSLDRSNTTKSDTDTDCKNSKCNEPSAGSNIETNKNGFLVNIFRSKRFIRQQSAPVCTNSRTDVSNKINRMLSEGNVVELAGVSALDVVDKINSGRADLKGNDMAGKFIRDNSDAAIKNNRPDIECERAVVRGNYGSLRRSVLLNSAKANVNDVNRDRVKRKLKVKCSTVAFKKSKTADCDCPESFV